MKKISITLILLLGILVMACQKKSNQVEIQEVFATVVTGKIKIYDGRPMQITGEDFTKQLTISPDGSFADTLFVEPNYYTIENVEYGPVAVLLYLNKGDSIHVDIDTGVVPPVATVSGRGFEESAYLQQKVKLHKGIEAEFLEYFKQKPKEFVEKLKEIEDKYEDIIEKQEGLSKKFIDLEKKGLTYYILRLKKIYPLIYERFVGEKMDLPQTFKDELEEVNLDLDTEFKTIPSYKDFVITYFGVEMENIKNKTDEEFRDFVEDIRKMNSKSIKGEVLRMAGNAFNVANSKENNELLVSVIRENVEDSVFLKSIEEKVARLEPLYPGNPAPDFSFENYNGGVTSLASLKGKLVYIDIWATWCKPCLHEIPYLQALKKDFQGKDIAFVGISIDHKKQDWENFMKENKLEGYQLFANLSVEDNFTRKYDVMYIPRFVLIDKEGKIINANAPSPSNSEIKDLINRHL